MKKSEIAFGVLRIPVDILMTVLAFASAYRLRTVTDLLPGFNLPIDFYKAVEKIPISLSLDNAGTKNASNLLIKIKTRTEIIDTNIDVTEPFDIIDKSGNSITIQTANLNPSGKIKLLIYCKKDDHPNEKIVTESDITTSEGRVIDRKALSSQQVYQEVLEKILSSLPMGIGNIAKLTIRTGEREK